MHVETQGSSGATPLAPEVVRAADAVITDDVPEDAVDLEHAHASTGVHPARPAAASAAG